GKAEDGNAGRRTRGQRLYRLVPAAGGVAFGGVNAASPHAHVYRHLKILFAMKAVKPVLATKPAKKHENYLSRYFIR
ncbi:MAG: hypothetical protein ACRC02_05195, partial [Vogesella sp.]